jgi:hypothetical protein
MLEAVKASRAKARAEQMESSGSRAPRRKNHTHPTQGCGYVGTRLY